MAGLWARYNALLEAQPLLTKALTSLTGFTAGDILAQSFIEPGDKPYDVMRTIRLGSFGFLLHGTTGHYFYGMLDSKLPGTAPLTVATKVAIDQTIWNPIFGLMFFGYLNVMEGKSFDTYVNKIKADLKTAVMGSWAVWVPAHTIVSKLFGNFIFSSTTKSHIIPSFRTLPSSLPLSDFSTSTLSKSVTTFSFLSSETRKSTGTRRNFKSFLADLQSSCWRLHG